MNQSIANFYHSPDALLIECPRRAGKLKGRYAPISVFATSQIEMTFKWDYYDGDRRKCLPMGSPVDAETFTINRKDSVDKVSFVDQQGDRWSFLVETSPGIFVE